MFKKLEIPNVSDCLITYFVYVLNFTLSLVGIYKY